MVTHTDVILQFYFSRLFKIFSKDGKKKRNQFVTDLFVVKTVQNLENSQPWPTGSDSDVIADYSSVSLFMKIHGKFFCGIFNFRGNSVQA